MQDSIDKRFIPQILPDEKRFHIQHEDWARERVHGIRESLYEIQIENPEVCGYTIFGSLVKGLSRPETDPDPSDLDIAVFVEADDVESVYGDNTLTKESVDGFMSIQFSEPVRQYYEESIKASLLKTCNLTTPELVNDVRVYPISRKLIDEEINFLIQEVHEGRKRFVSPGAPLWHLFHLGVGKGIEPYRGYLIRKLQSSGSAGDVIWEKIIYNVEALERDNRVNTSLKYPRILSDAADVYCKPQLKRS